MMATSTIVAIGISLMAFAFMGLLIGYTLGHEEGYDHGFQVGLEFDDLH